MRGILSGRSLEVLRDLLAQRRWLQDLYMLPPPKYPAYDLKSSTGAKTQDERAILLFCQALRGMPFALAHIRRLFGGELQHDIQLFFVIDNAKGALAFGLYVLPWEPYLASDLSHICKRCSIFLRGSAYPENSIEESVIQHSMKQ